MADCRSGFFKDLKYLYILETKSKETGKKGLLLEERLIKPPKDTASNPSKER
uniref:Uncharacterized protein n=1 Tax=Rhizophora mucronata TaxID=61149 RepID=A0A2P2JFT0_RHIMU